MLKTVISLSGITRTKIPQPAGETAISKEEALVIGGNKPSIIRPSYVLGGRAMKLLTDELAHYMEHAVEASPDHPVLVDRYLTGQEIEVDAICDGETY